MPAGIDSPGYLEEQRNKPRITKKIEEDDVVLSPESVAKSLLAGTSGRCFCFFLLVHPVRGGDAQSQSRRRDGNVRPMGNVAGLALAN
jgi:hypothetical protein